MKVEKNVKWWNWWKLQVVITKVWSRDSFFTTLLFSVVISGRKYLWCTVSPQAVGNKLALIYLHMRAKFVRGHFNLATKDFFKQKWSSSSLSKIYSSMISLRPVKRKVFSFFAGLFTCRRLSLCVNHLMLMWLNGTFEVLHIHHQPCNLCEVNDLLCCVCVNMLSLAC